MTVDSNQDGTPNYFPNSFMGPVDSTKWKQVPIQVNTSWTNDSKLIVSLHLILDKDKEIYIQG